MKLSNYCTLVKTYVNNSISTIDREGYVIGSNNKEYSCKVEFLDDSVVSLVEYVLQGDVEKDVDFGEAMRLAGIVEGYLQYTGVAGKVIKDRNPLGFLKR